LSFTQARKTGIKVGMKRRLMIAALAVPAMWMPAAHAQQPDGGQSLLGDSYVSAGETARFAPSPSAPASGSILSLSNRIIVEEDGSRRVRKGMVGSWPVKGGLSVGVGLFSVTADARKQRQFRASADPMDMRGRRQRVAAVGMSLRF